MNEADVYKLADQLREVIAKYDSELHLFHATILMPPAQYAATKERFTAQAQAGILIPLQDPRWSVSVMPSEAVTQATIFVEAVVADSASETPG